MCELAEQEAQLSQRDRATPRRAVADEILSTAAQLYEIKSHFKSLQ